MLILGIDPGSRKTGFGVIKVVSRRKIEYVDSGILRYDNIASFLDRLHLIHQNIEELIQKYNPDEISVESLVYVKSVTSLAKLAQARGAMIAAMSKTHLGKVYEYSPNLVKSTVSGYGHANKENMIKAIRMMFGNIDFKSHDESDALAIAICHSLLGGQTPKNIVGSGKKRSLKSIAENL